MRYSQHAAWKPIAAAVLLFAFSGIAYAELPAPRKVGVGSFVRLSTEDFDALVPEKADLALLEQKIEAASLDDSLGMSLARMSFERLAQPAPWKSKGEASPEIAISGSFLDFVPEEYGKFPGEIVAAFYSYDGAKIRLLPFILQKDSTALRMLPSLTGAIDGMDNLVSALVLGFQEGLLDRKMAPGENAAVADNRLAQKPPESFALSSRLDWKHDKEFKDASSAFYGALGRFVAGVSFSALSAGTYFLYSEAYSRSAASIGSVYATGGLAVACVAASAFFAVQSVLGLSRLLSFSR